MRKTAILLCSLLLFCALPMGLYAQPVQIFQQVPLLTVLDQFNYEYELGPNNTPISNHLLVVEFQDTISPSMMQQVRAQNGVVSYRACMCNEFLEEWDFGGLPPNGILGKKADADADPAVRSSDFSYFVSNNFLSPITLPPGSPMLFPPQSASPAPAGAPLIAILDTGVDYLHDSLKAHIWLGNEIPNGGDDDSDCLADDFIGWNFVHENNNPSDDHGHGTHVAGIVVQNLLRYAPNCPFRVMPLKTHDLHGVGTLFSVTCATYYASVHGARVINDSWGWYGSPSGMLSKAIDFAHTNSESLVLAAAGNDGFDVTANPHYPSNYNLPNVVSVMYIDSSGNLPSGANYSATEVDIAHYGQNVLSTLPLNSLGFSTGSSMATPGVSAATASVICCFSPPTALDLRNWILSTAISEPSLSGRCVTEGRAKFPGPNCQYCDLEADFSFSSLPNNCRGLRFNASVSKGTAPYSYSWTFGGLATSNLAGPSYVFPANGTYQVCLTVVDSAGCAVTRCRTVAVPPPCQADSLDFCTTVEPSGTTRFRISVSNVSYRCNGTATVAYSFNGGTTWSNVGSLLVSSPGIYNVCVRVTCTVCGQTCVLNCCKQVNVGLPCNIPSTATLTVVPGTNGAATTLRASALTPAAAAYDWDFNNDGVVDATTTGATTTFVYPEGRHSACVTIRRSAGCEKRICVTFAVQQLCNPTANFRFRRCSGSPLELAFTSIVANAPLGVLWEFGDGNTSTALNPQHSYAQPGTYTVCLTAYRSQTCSTRVCYTIQVLPKF
jgi:PKD repeat protein